MFKDLKIPPLLKRIKLPPLVGMIALGFVANKFFRSYDIEYSWMQVAFQGQGIMVVLLTLVP